MKLIVSIALALLAVTLSAPARAQVALESVNSILPGCRDFIAFAQRKPIPDDAMLKAGLCAGKISTLINVRAILEPKFRFCPPHGTTLIQTIETAVKGIETVPNTWHEPFDAMALAALVKLWPCQ